MSDVITLNHVPLAVLIVRKVYDMYRRGEFFSHLFMSHWWHFLQQQDAIDCTKRSIATGFAAAVMATCINFLYALMGATAVACRKTFQLFETMYTVCLLRETNVHASFNYIHKILLTERFCNIVWLHNSDTVSPI